MKRIIGIVVSVLLIFSTIPVVNAAETVVQAEHYESGTCLANWGDCLRMYTNNSISYTVDFKTAGTYMLKVFVGGNYVTNSSIKASIGGNEIGTASFGKTGGDRKWLELNVGVFDVASAGEKEITISVPGGNYTFDKFSVSVAPDFEITDMKSGEQSFEDGDVIPRGADILTIDFTYDIDPDSIKGIALSDGNDTVDISVKSSGNKITVELNETLDYETDYTLTLPDIKNMYKQSFTKEVMFSTGTDTEDSGYGKVVIDETASSLSGEQLTIKGVVTSSAGKGISGRSISFDYTDKDNKSVTVDDVVLSGKNGDFVINHEISSETTGGSVSFNVYDEYASESDTVYLIYVSEELEERILGAFEQAADVQSVMDVFDTISTELGYDVTSEISDIADTDAFYSHFECAVIDDMTEFLRLVKEYSTLETILQTEDAGVVEDFFGDSSVLELMGIRKSRIDKIVENRDNLIADIIALDSIYSLEDFASAVEKCVNKYYYSECDMVIQAEDYADGSCLADWGDCLRLYNANKLNYIVNFDDVGTYKLVAKVAQSVAQDSTLVISVDGKEIGTATVKKTGGDRNWTELFVTSFYLGSTGQKTVSVSVPSGNLTMDSFTISLVPEFEPEAFYTSELQFDEGDTIPRGTDIIAVDFVSDIKSEAVTESAVKLTDGVDFIPVRYEAMADKLLIKLEQTLDFDTDYELIFNLYSIYGQKYSETISFSAGSSDEDSGSGLTTIDDTNTSLKYEMLTLKGHVESGVNVPISGRKVSFDIEDKDGKKTTVKDAAVTGADGLFSITYTLPVGTPCGKVILTVYDEYTKNPDKSELMYVSEALEGQILGNFKDSKDTTDVTDVFDLLKEQAAYDISGDITHLGDKDAFYAHFIGAVLSDMDTFLEYCTKHVIMETLLQATEQSAVEAILGSEDDCKLVGIDKAKTDYIVDNHSDFVNEIISLDDIKDLASFVTEFGKLADKYYLKESGKNDSVSSLTDESGYLGQGVVLDLGFTAKQTEVSKVTYRFSCTDDEIFDIYKFSDASVQIRHSEGYLTVERTFTDASDITSIGKLTLTLPDKVKTYTLSVSGEVEYKIDGPYTVTTNITPKTIDIKAKENSGGNHGGSPSTSPVRVVTGTNKTEEKPKDEQIPQNEAYAFTDMDSALWAKESVDALVQSGIISKSDDKLYRPNDNVTREEFVKLLVCAFGAHETLNSQSFSDVDSSAWYAPYVASAVANGLVNGKEDGSFGVGEGITRQDMAVMVYRALGKMGYPMSDAAQIGYYDTAEISDYAYEAVSEISKRGIMNGTGDNLFSPKGSVTRAMAAKVIYEISKVVGI